jgi:phytoene dehydrogenase-like protein
MERDRKIIIIGAGVAGLSAGAYLQMNGYDTEILEMDKNPGGLCTAWKRKDYLFDGCLHWLLGTNPGNPFYRVWSELGVVGHTPCTYFNALKQIELAAGGTFTVHTNLDRLCGEMKALAPEDGAVIDEFIAAAKYFAAHPLPLETMLDMRNPVATAAFLVRHLPSFLAFRRHALRTIGEYADRFSSPRLREAFIGIIGSTEMSVAVLMLVLSWFHVRAAGYLPGGSLAVTKPLEQRYLALGGRIYYSTRVTGITTVQGAVTGVQVERGSEYRARIVVSAADGNATIFRMLGGEYVNRRIIEDYNTLPLFPAMMQVSLGVSRAFDGTPPLMTVALDRPFVVDDKTRLNSIDVTVYNFDAAFAPAGKTVVAARFPASYEYWLNLRNNHARKYLMEKERIATEVTGILDKRLGDIAAKREVSDVATPATYIRYTNCWRGSYEGFLPTPAVLTRRMPRTLPGLKNFYLAGQWTTPGGGLPAAALSGRTAAAAICKKDGRHFRTHP